MISTKFCCIAVQCTLYETYSADASSTYEWPGMKACDSLFFTWDLKQLILQDAIVFLVTSAR